MEISGNDAWSLLLNSKSTRWSNNIARFKEELVVVQHAPKFYLNDADSFFCIGSCFARNIEEHLIYNGATVLSKRIVCPKCEWSGRANGIVGKFTTSSICNEIDWLLEPPGIINESFFESVEGGWLDLQLAPGIRPVSLERAVERREYLLRDYFSRLRHASVVVITLGLNEAWRDNKLGRYLNATPSVYSVRREPERYSLVITDVDFNLNALERIRLALMAIRPDMRIVVTVSPVPMSATFSGRDVCVANTFSKSVLRVAADTFADRHSNVDHFPTYDMVSLSPRDMAYREDCLHVSRKIVGKMVSLFLTLYLQRNIVPVDFDDVDYLKANPDVEEAVRLGQLESGYEHWMKYGKNEDCAQAPTLASGE